MIFLGSVTSRYNIYLKLFSGLEIPWILDFSGSIYEAAAKISSQVFL